MKKLILLLLAVSPLCLIAQTNTSLAAKDTAGVGKLVHPLWILDGKELSGDVKWSELKQMDICSSTVLKDEAAKTAYGDKGANGVVVLVTTKAAVHAYQEKFSDFSADYESYLTSHGTDDKQFIYLVDNVALAKDKKEAATLMGIPKDKIDNVVFIQDQPEGSKILAKVAITTKK